MQLFIVGDADFGGAERLIAAENGDDALTTYSNHFKRQGYIIEVLGKHDANVFAMPKIWRDKLFCAAR